MTRTAAQTEAGAAAGRATHSLGASISAADFTARTDATVPPVATSHSYVVGGLFPTVPTLAAALRALRGAGRTEDVVGLAIPLEGDDPDAGIVRTRKDAASLKPRFNLAEFLLTAIDPHRQRPWTARWAPGQNDGLAVDLLGNVTRWLVGIQPMKLHQIPGGQALWVLARPNHSAALNRGSLAQHHDADEGYAGVLATLGVPSELSALCAERLLAGDCLLTTCETDRGRCLGDARLMQRAGARHVFDPHPLTWRYGVRKPHGGAAADDGVRRTHDTGVRTP